MSKNHLLQSIESKSFYSNIFYVLEIFFFNYIFSFKLVNCFD